MAKYKIEFSGFAYVEAENKEEAEEKYNAEDITYMESEVDEILTISEFEVEV